MPPSPGAGGFAHRFRACATSAFAGAGGWQNRRRLRDARGSPPSTVADGGGGAKTHRHPRFPEPWQNRRCLCPGRRARPTSHRPGRGNLAGGLDRPEQTRPRPTGPVHFETLYNQVTTPISKARAAYWAGHAARRLTCRRRHMVRPGGAHPTRTPIGARHGALRTLPLAAATATSNPAAAIAPAVGDGDTAAGRRR